MSDRGRKRSRNEDAWLAADALGLYVVADGVGGAPAGDIASRRATDAIAEHIVKNPGAEESAMALLQAAVRIANTTLFHEAILQPALAGMCTTAAALLVRGEHCFIAHVGDSRIYRFRNGALTQLTIDHTLAQDRFDRGLIGREQLRVCGYGHVLTKTVGLEPEITATSADFHALDGDRYLLCTDGLTTMLQDEVIQDLLKAGGDCLSVCDRLVAEANRAGGHDNVTVVLVEMMGN
ncbi:MAG TPA: protein phosphatase 2C domain-containing protein [Dissulfurispiraceae bacterium]|nr:protein phosphatase 2C domain-containing protein [Dissulfurispiraceae bacterium]